MLRDIKYILIILLVFSEMGWGQTSTQNFGTGTGSQTSQTGSTSFIPNPTSGTTWARAGATAPNAPINLVTASNPLGTTGAYAQGVASSSTSVSKFSPMVAYTGSTEFYTSFKVLFGDASAGNTATTGSWSFYQGVGAMYSDANNFTGSMVFTGLQFTYGASGAITLNYRAASAWSTTGLTTSAFNQATVYTIEIIGNNKTSGTISYTYNGVAKSVAVQKFDLYINGTLIGDDLAEAALTANTSITSTTFIGVSSTSNAANVFVDDVVVYNSVPAAIGCTAPTTSPAASHTETSQSTTNVRFSWTTPGDADGVNVYKASDGSSLQSGNTAQFYDYTTTANTQVGIKVKAYKGATSCENASFGTAASAYSSQNDPTSITFSAVGTNTITATANGTFPNQSQGSSGVYIRNSTNSTNSGVMTSTTAWANGSLTCNTSYSYYAKAYNGDGDVTNEIGPTSQSTSACATPTLTATASSLTGFTYVFGAGPSAVQSFVLTGTNLTGADVTLTASTSYEISLSNFSATSPITLTAYDGSSTTIYVRLKAGLAVNTYNSENVVIAGGGATSINETNSGSVTAAGSDETIRVLSYNLLGYTSGTYLGCDQTNNSIVAKDGYLVTIINHIQPDLIGVTEMRGWPQAEANTDMDRLITNSLDVVDGAGTWARGPWINATSDPLVCQLYYNQNKFTLISTTDIDCSPAIRNVPIFKLQFHSNDASGNPIYLYALVMHTKAGSGETADRSTMTSKVMAYLNGLGTAENFIIMGDFNLYNSDEEAYQNMIAHTNPDIKFNDPINTPGTWTNNGAFASVHTQSTRYDFDGDLNCLTGVVCGADCGSDDRFDFILTSTNIIDGTKKVLYEPGSYKVVGQDGNHFNKAINDGANASAPAGVITALYNNSDHYPVRLDLTFKCAAAGTSTITAVAASEPATISSIENTAIITTNTEGALVWQFKLYDGDGSANDADALPTIYTAFTINQGASNTVTNWSAAILALEFFEGTNTTPVAGNLILSATSILFTPATSISVPDGAASSKTITMRLSLKNPLPASSDNKIFHFKIINTNVTTESSATSSQLAVFTINSDGTKNKIDVVKTKLLFTSVPNMVGLSTNFTVTVAATDANGNTDADATDNVTLAKATGTGTLSSASGLIKPLSSGTYTWTDVQYNTAETFTIKVTAAGLTTVTSGNILCVNDGTYTTTIVEWNFPPNPKDQYADAGIALNYDPITPSNSKTITSTLTSAINYTYSGQQSLSAYATEWDNGSGTTFWQVEFNTTGYNTLKLTSYQRSSGTGPKDFKIQYKIGAGAWTDVASGTVTVGDNWTGGVITNLALASACDNQSSISIRWIMTSNTAVGGGGVASGGSSRIDNIKIIGTSGNTITTSSISGSPFCVTTVVGVSVSVPFTSTGTFNSGNIYTAQLSDATGSFAVATDIGTLTSTANSGTISATIPAGTADGANYRIRVVSSDPVRTGSDNGVNLEVYLNTPDASNFNALTASGQITLNWTNPTGCYGDALIVAKATSNVDAGTPSGDGSSYSANLSYGSGSSLLGGYVVYKGNTTGQTVTNLTNGTTYFFKIFLRKGTAWSNGIEISATPSTTLSGEFRSAVASVSWTTIAHWETYNGSGWVAASSYPDDKTKNVTIKSGTTVDLNASSKDVKDLIVENGGKLYTNQTSTPTYISIYGNNLICNGIIGNGSTIDGIAFNIEGTNVTISGTGTFDAMRIRKIDNVTNNTTNLIIAMNVNLHWNDVSGTQIYNNGAAGCIFNVIVNEGSLLNLILDAGGTSGNASIDGVAGADGAALGGTFTVNGTMNIPGILYATTNNATVACKWVIGTNGVINCNQVNCSYNTVTPNGSGAGGHEIEILNGGKLNMTTNMGFTNFSMTNNTYDFQDGSTVEYSSSSGTQVIQPSQSGFEYSNLLISTDGATKQVNSSSDLTVKKNLTITGGVLDPNGKNIYVGGNWSNYGTNGFSEGTTGTIFFNGTSAQTISCPGGENFYKLDFSNAGTKTLNDNITVASNLTINSGSGAFTANGFDISVGGNWSNYGTAGFTEGTAGTVTFNGSASQSITCTGDENYYNLNINNSSTGVSLNNDCNVFNLLTLTQGKVTTSSSNYMNVTNNSTTSITGYQTDPTLGSNYTSSPYINGNLKRNVALTGAYDFPVGSSANYELANITLNTGTAGVSDITASFTTPITWTGPNPTIVVNGVTETIDAYLDAGFWTISPNTGSFNYDVTLISGGHSNGGTVPGQHTIVKRTTAGPGAWTTYAANHTNSTQSGSGSDPITAKLTAMTSFSDFTIGRKSSGSWPNSALPVELLDFTAKYNTQFKTVDLTWYTASEINNDYFTIGHSADGINFEMISRINGAGNSNTLRTYNATDYNPFQKLSYYRLDQVDIDGKTNYSKVLAVEIPADQNESNFILIDKNQPEIISLENTSNVHLDFIDIWGRILYAEDYPIIEKYDVIPIKNNNLPVGVYLIRLSDTENVKVLKYIKDR
ncbi:MAG: endonuclease/exonuclease/phosphatase family protein [Bacteroidia bacterium]|nr:endonuclease/exonuclease/phosphatase family protein [Bacteroidia bacterium]